jgi:hypothetical protein
MSNIAKPAFWVGLYFGAALSASLSWLTAQPPSGFSTAFWWLLTAIGIGFYLFGPKTSG